MLPVVPPIEWTPLYATDSVSYGTLIYWALYRTGQCWVTALKRNYAKGGTESETRQKGNVGGKYCVELLSLKFLWRTAHLREQRGRGGLSRLILTWVYSLLHVAVLCRKIWMIMAKLVKIWLLQDSQTHIRTSTTKYQWVVFIFLADISKCCTACPALSQIPPVFGSNCSYYGCNVIIIEKSADYFHD